VGVVLSEVGVGFSERKAGKIPCAHPSKEASAQSTTPFATPATICLNPILFFILRPRPVRFGHCFGMGRVSRWVS
jgi:hypothetical protein